MNTRTRGERVLLALLNYSPIILFLIIFAVFGALAPRFLEWSSFLNILKQSSHIGILAVGMTFVLLTAGIDLSVGSIMYLAAVVFGLLVVTYDAPIWLGLLGCLATGVAFGAVNAFLITRLNVIPFIVTLSTLIAGRGLGLAITRSRGITLPNDVFTLSSLTPLGVPISIWVFAVVVLIAAIILRFTPFGRRVYAVGNNAEVAEKSALSPRRTIGAVYLISGFCAALAAFVGISQLGIVNPAFGEMDELDAIAAAVLGGASLFGGVGTVFPGTVLGAVMIQMVQSGLVFTRVDIFVQPIILALVIFFSVAIDSLRNMYIARLTRRTIRKESGAAKPAGSRARQPGPADG